MYHKMWQIGQAPGGYIPYVYPKKSGRGINICTVNLSTRWAPLPGITCVCHMNACSALLLTLYLALFVMIMALEFDGHLVRTVVSPLGFAKVPALHNSICVRNKTSFLVRPLRC